MTRSPLGGLTMHPVPAPDRYRLAVLIRHDIPPQAGVDARYIWPEEGEARVQPGALERAKFSRRLLRGQPLVAWGAEAAAFCAHHEALPRALPPPRSGQITSPGQHQKECGR
jgi:hypothetical protein